MVWGMEREQILAASAQLANESRLMAECGDSQEFDEILGRLRGLVDSLSNAVVMAGPVEA